MRGSDEREYGNRIRGHHGGELLSDRPKSCLAKWIEFWCSLPESRTGGPDCIPRIVRVASGDCVACRFFR
jgi:hypothetical protein